MIAYLAYFGVQGIQLAALFRLAPRFFWFDDSQSQFGPMAWWLGRHLRGGRPPLMDADQGMAGNFVADMQYGVLDPLHWVLQWIASLSDDFIVMSWTFACLCLLLLGSGSLWVLLHHRVRPVLAVAGAIGIASSGMLLWYGGSWWPLMWSSAWLPWLWMGLASNHRRGVVVAGLATWALLASGNPYAVPFGALIVVTQLLEQLRQHGSVRAIFHRGLIARLMACAGGVVAALPTLLSAVQIAPLMGRISADPVIGNTGFAVPNLADVVIGGTTVLGQTNAWGGSIGVAPAMATALVALPVLALVCWKDAVRAPGVLTALVICAAAAVCSQLPTTVSVFRYPMRYLVFFQLFLPLLALIAVSSAPRLTGTRLAVAGVLVLSQFMLAIFRSPTLLPWHALALVLTGLGAAAAASLLRGSRSWLGATASAAVVGTTALALLVGERMMVAVQQRVNELNGRLGAAEGQPYRAVIPGYQLGTTVKEYRRRSYAVDDVMTVLVWGTFGEDRGWKAGIVSGNGNLVSDLKVGYGSLALWQSELARHWCHDYQGATCSGPAELLAVPPGLSRPWVDLLASNKMLLHRDGPAEVKAYFDSNGNWRKVKDDGTWFQYHRLRPLPGRITEALHVEISRSGWRAGLAYPGRAQERYVVSTGLQRGSLVFRTPYWPGFRATLDGREVPVSSLDESVLKVDVPPRASDSKLEIFYDPIGARISTPASSLGVGIIGAAAFAMPRRSRRRPGASEAPPAR